MKSSISNKWLVLKYDIEKYLIKNFSMFVNFKKNNFYL